MAFHTAKRFSGRGGSRQAHFKGKLHTVRRLFVEFGGRFSHFVPEDHQLAVAVVCAGSDQVDCLSEIMTAVRGRKKDDARNTLRVDRER